MNARLSPARRRALEVLVEGERTGRTVRESNHTTQGDETIWCTRRGCGELVTYDAATARWTHQFVDDAHPALPQPLTIYWQTQVWLHDKALITSNVTVTANASGRICRLTKAGRELAKEARIS